MADGLQTIGVGDSPTASKLNKIARRVVIDCTSSTHPGSPLEGQHIYETDTTMLRRYDGSNWITYPNGIIAHDTVVSTSPGTGGMSAISGSGLTIACVDGEWYTYEIDVVCASDTATDRMNLQVQKDSGSGYVDFGHLRTVYIHAAGEGYPCSIREVWHGTYDGFTSFRLRAQMVTGTGNIPTGTDCFVAHEGNYSAT